MAEPEYPARITLAWLWKHAPVSLWFGGLGLLGASVGAGIWLATSGVASYFGVVPPTPSESECKPEAIGEKLRDLVLVIEYKDGASARASKLSRGARAEGANVILHRFDPMVPPQLGTRASERVSESSVMYSDSKDLQAAYIVVQLLQEQDPSYHPKVVFDEGAGPGALIAVLKE
jgi:hypothetical protein